MGYFVRLNDGHHYSQWGLSGAVGVHHITDLARPLLLVFCAYGRTENQK